jgi:hypothetical protein
MDLPYGSFLNRSGDADYPTLSSVKVDLMIGLGNQITGWLDILQVIPDPTRCSHEKIILGSGDRQYKGIINLSY